MEMNEHDIMKFCTPQTWQPMTSEKELFQLSQGSKEFKYVMRKINQTLKGHVKSIFRVQNPYLWGCYQLKKLEYAANDVSVREVEMFHCTAQSNIDSIAMNNLDWRRNVRSKYGKGVSFSPSAAYANRYANYNIGMDRALILTTVLVGREILGSNSMSFPPQLFDTSFGRNCKGKTMVYVKYCDYEFYPSYVAYYDTTDLYPQFTCYPDYYNNLYFDNNNNYFDSYI